MRSFHLPLVALLLTAPACPAWAAPPAQLISAEQKSSCRFVCFVNTRATTGPDRRAAALKDALARAGGYGADSFYVMSNVEDQEHGALVDGQALNCKSR